LFDQNDNVVKTEVICLADVCSNKRSYVVDHNV